MRGAAAALLPLALGGCMNTAIPVPAPGTRFDPIAFFAGRTAGEGTLHTVLGDRAPIRVRSIGRPDGKGGLVLTQVIAQGAKPPRQRRWTIRPEGGGRYTGELTDARGPVRVAVSGGGAWIGYTMKNGMQVNQFVALQADGRTLANRLNVDKFGLAVARVDETIRKLD